MGRLWRKWMKLRHIKERILGFMVMVVGRGLLRVGGGERLWRGRRSFSGMTTTSLPLTSKQVKVRQ